MAAPVPQASLEEFLGVFAEGAPVAAAAATSSEESVGGARAPSASVKEECGTPEVQSKRQCGRQPFGEKLVSDQQLLTEYALTIQVEPAVTPAFTRQGRLTSKGGASVAIATAAVRHVYSLKRELIRTKKQARDFAAQNQSFKEQLAEQNTKMQVQEFKLDKSRTDLDTCQERLKATELRLQEAITNAHQLALADKATEKARHETDGMTQVTNAKTLARVVDQLSLCDEKTTLALLNKQNGVPDEDPGKLHSVKECGGRAAEVI